MGRSTVYAARDREESDGPAGLKKRGPKTKLSDEELVEEIRQVLKESDFLGEGHRKVRARLRAKGIGVGKNRVLRLMRENGLLAPVRRGKHRSSPELCVKVRGSSSMLLLGCLGDLLRFEKREIQVATFAPGRSSP